MQETIRQCLITITAGLNPNKFTTGIVWILQATELLISNLEVTYTDELHFMKMP